MKPILLFAALSGATPIAASVSRPENEAPERVDVVDAIECRLDAPLYNGFALALNGEEEIAKKRRWVRIKSKNFFMNEYQLPAPVTVAGDYSTRRIAFTSSGVLAILDLADPTLLARKMDVENSADASPLIEAMIASGKATPAEIEAARTSGKFLGEAVLVNRVERPAAGERFGTHTVIARNISNVTSHPGKTLYGCTYRIELIDKDGRPL